MPRAGGIEVEGRVIEVLPNGLCRVELPNGHRIQAYRGRSLRLGAGGLAAGDRVTVVMSAFDMTKGCITNRHATT